MKKPTPEQFGLTKYLLVLLEENREAYETLRARTSRWVKLVIAAGVIAAFAIYIGYRFDWPLFIALLLIGAVVMVYLSPLATEAILHRLDPHSHSHKLLRKYQVESIIYEASWVPAYWEAFWKALSTGGSWNDGISEFPHSRLRLEGWGKRYGRTVQTILPDPGKELFFVLDGKRCVLRVPQPSEPVNQELADRLLKIVELSKAEKGLICSDENIPQEIRNMLQSSNIGILPSHLLLSSPVLRLAIWETCLPVLELAAGPFVTPWQQFCSQSHS